jgi:hypothetical protein
MAGKRGVLGADEGVSCAVHKVRAGRLYVGGVRALEQLLPPRIFEATGTEIARPDHLRVLPHFAANYPNPLDPGGVLVNATRHKTVPVRVDRARSPSVDPRCRQRLTPADPAAARSNLSKRCQDVQDPPGPAS